MVDPSLLGLAGPGFDHNDSGNRMGRMAKTFCEDCSSYRMARYGKSSQECSTVCAWVCMCLCTCSVWVLGCVSGRTLEGEASNICMGTVDAVECGSVLTLWPRSVEHLSYNFPRRGSKRRLPYVEQRQQSGVGAGRGVGRQRTFSMESTRMILIC